MNRHRDKGRRFERKVRRTFEESGWEVLAPKGGGGSQVQDADLVASREYPSGFPYSTKHGPVIVTAQCKNHAILRLPEWLRELREDVLIVNVPRQGVYVVEELGAWIGRQS